MDLFIIRHAQAGRFGDPAWPDDSQRPLTDEGQRRFALMVETLAERGFAPEIIATSPAVRCRQTAEIVAQGVPDRPEVVELAALLPGNDLKALMDWTKQQSAQFRRIAWVGHAPDVGRLAAELIGDRATWIRFSKGAIAAIRFPGSAELGGGELRWLVTSKTLGC
ncbi:MAG: phosphohistidine phosphatase SixA [Planctomycetes bacterium RBG_13_63_9]|nr:MAG: phosphohistidine phosphatase SixA [Planctomycetes bacterium RBG_13_63_9]